jgi:zinc transport system ATP-binding protein
MRPRHRALATAANLPLGLRLVQVRCTYGRRVVVDGVDLHVDAGEHVALTGSNGSGKTTLLRAILGLHPLASGTIELGGRHATNSAGWAERRRRIAWVPQRLAPGRFPLLVHELLASSGQFACALDAAELLNVVELADRPLHTLSGGQLQRVFLARALGCLKAGATVLLADEPTAALDFDAQEAVARLLAGIQATIVVVSHDRAMTAVCDRQVEMAAGRIRTAA